MNCTLINSTRSRNSLRTDSVEGDTASLPVLGLSFTMFAKPLNDMGLGLRLVSTSPVVEIDHESETKIHFVTESGSNYTLVLT